MSVPSNTAISSSALQTRLSPSKAVFVRAALSAWNDIWTRPSCTATSGAAISRLHDAVSTAMALIAKKITVFFMFILFYHSKVPRSSNGSVMPSGLSQRTEGTDAESSHKGVRYSLD